MVFDEQRMRIGIAAILMVAGIGCGDGTQPSLEPPDMMSAVVEIGGWTQEYEPELYLGDSLFELINGGAEVYHRFGFAQALATQYADAEGRSISLEIFEMGDVAGARNIYSDKTGGSGEELEIGDEAAGEDYYLNFRSGRYLVTITGFDNEPPTTDGILKLARAVAAELGGAE